MEKWQHFLLKLVCRSNTESIHTSCHTHNSKTGRLFFFNGIICCSWMKHLATYQKVLRPFIPNSYSQKQICSSRGRWPAFVSSELWFHWVRWITSDSPGWNHSYTKPRINYVSIHLKALLYCQRSVKGPGVTQRISDLDLWERNLWGCPKNVSVVQSSIMLCTGNSRPYRERRLPCLLTGGTPQRMRISEPF